MRGGQRSVLLLLILVVAAVVLAVLRNTEAGSAVQGGALGAIAPVRSALSGAASGAAATLADAQRFNDLRAENEALRAEVVQLRSAAAGVQATRRENEALRAALDYQRANSEWTLLTGRVAGRDSIDALDTLVIDRGAADGVRVGMAVVANGRLAGRVLAVTTTSADVLPIQSSQSAVNAVAQGKDGTADGIVEGDDNGGLVLTRIEPDAPLAIGDLVVTSGLGGGFPRGLPVGRVIAVFTTPENVFREAAVEPFVRSERLDVIQVIVERAPGSP
ncbi:MAG: rod shape-determining protein MreC [Chloroflexota bacterium]|nr:rod shape-determining protein MreC [Chloroflexota bacterium]